MIVVRFTLDGKSRKVVIGELDCRTEATKQVMEAFLGCEIISTSTRIPGCMYELVPVGE